MLLFHLHDNISSFQIPLKSKNLQVISIDLLLLKISYSYHCLIISLEQWTIKKIDKFFSSHKLTK